MDGQMGEKKVTAGQWVVCDWAHNHAKRYRYATVKEIDAESVRRVFVQKGRKPHEYLRLML
ncbi:hypothetical protein LW858_25145 [Bacillus cereus]|nr:hypothetical protein [Bacillus cereus]UIJ66110.1 hypothetical protein LW858_25145 [Bacillus cereus]